MNDALGPYVETALTYSFYTNLVGVLVSSAYIALYYYSSSLQKQGHKVFNHILIANFTISLFFLITNLAYFSRYPNPLFPEIPPSLP